VETWRRRGLGYRTGLRGNNFLIFNCIDERHFGRAGHSNGVKRQGRACTGRSERYEGYALR
jgi:hypothetical protein